MDKLKAAAKFLLSFLKRDWEIEDYPIRFRLKKVDESPATGRLQPTRWTAQVVNWWALAGHGHSKAEAHGDLISNFQARKASGGRLPRPGTRVPIEFAPTTEVHRFEGIARDFLARVLNLNLDECFISDESSLWDFHHQETNDVFLEKIRNIYHVDVSAVEGAKLCTIFRIIAESQELV